MTSSSSLLNHARTTLEDALRLLASSPQTQLAYLSEHELGDCADELALDLYDAVILIEQFVHSGEVSEGVFQAAKDVDVQLHRMSGREQSNLWTRRALRTSLHWKEVRRLAKKAMRTL